MYDIVGDIHGHAVELKKLLAQMGYQSDRHAYRHPSRKIVFVGDLIDRGHEFSAVLVPSFAKKDWLHSHYRNKVFLLARGFSIGSFSDILFCNDDSN